MRRLVVVTAVGSCLFLAGCGQRQAPVPPPMPVQAIPAPAPAHPMPQSTAPAVVGQPQPPKSMPGSAKQAKADPVYITRTGKKYHRADCQHLAKGAAKMSRAQAQKEGYTACDTCNP